MRLTIRQLQPGHNYKAQVRATDGTNYSDWSALFEFTANSDVVAPSAPGSLSWTSKGTSFLATWTAPTTNSDGSPLQDLSDYQVILRNTAGTKSATYYTKALRFDFTLEANRGAFGSPLGTIVIEVRARDISGNLSSVVSGTASNPAPGNVTGFTATGAYDSIIMNWGQVADNDIQFYRVRQGTSAGTVNTVIFEGLATSFTWDTISTASQYFSVVAVDVFGTESPTPATANATAKSSLSVDNTPPSVPTTVTVATGVDSTDNGKSYLDVSWTAPSDTDLQNYLIRYSTNSAGPWQYLSVPRDTTAARILGLTPNANYYVGVQSVDYSGNVSAFTNASTYPITTAKDTTAPNAPSAPIIAANTLQIQVRMDGKDSAGNPIASDIDYYEIYVDAADGFIPTLTLNLVGTIKAGAASVSTFNVPARMASGNAQTWYAKAIAVDKSGNRSAESPQSNASVPLIDSQNIQDATITNAKIHDLAADKITAGSGIINDLLIKSALTINSAGVVKSSNYAAGSAGWQLSSSGLEINDGSIAAKALKIQNGSNIVPPYMADFEFAPSYYVSGSTFYTAKDGTTSSLNTAIDTGAKKFSSQSFKFYYVKGDGTYGKVGFCASSTDYNISVEPNTDYIFSAYILQSSGSSTSGAHFDVAGNNGAVTQTGATVNVPSDGAWARYSSTFNSGSSTAINIGLRFYSSGTFYIDGIQVEPQLAGSTAPSQWKPPGLTRIDGAIIRTGQIQSTAAAVGVSGQPAWSINMAGNAQFGDALVRGRLIVGDPNSPSSDTASCVRSANFASGSAGWNIGANGSVEFNSGVFRGTLGANVVDSNAIQAGAVQTSEIGLGAVTPALMQYGVDNLLPNPDWADANRRLQYPMNSPWEYNSTSYTYHSNGGYSVLLRTASSGGYATRNIAPFIPCKPGDKFYMRWWGKRSTGVTTPAAFNLRVLQADQSTIAAYDLRPMTMDPNVDAANNFKLYEGVVTIPANGYFILPELKHLSSAADPTATTSDWWSWSDMELRRVVSGTGPGGQGIEISPQGINLYDSEGSDVISLTSNPPNYLTISQETASGPVTVASIDQDGNISGTTVSASDAFYYQGDELTDILDPMPRGMIAYAFCSTGVNYSTTEYGLFHIACQAVNGRLYRVKWQALHSETTTPFRTILRFRASGGIPTLGNTLQHTAAIGGASSTSYTREIEWLWECTTTDTIYWLVSAQSSAGTGFCSGAAGQYMIFSIEDMGLVGQVNEVLNNGGGTAAPAQQNYQKTYNAVWSGSYTGGGSYNSYYGNKVSQGYYSSTNGNQKGMIGFPDQIKTDITGATVSKIEVYLYANWWYYNSGGTAVIGCHGVTQAAGRPGTFSGTTNLVQSSFSIGQGKWVTLPSSTYSSWVSGAYRGITTGPGPTTSATYYGRFDGYDSSSNKPKLRITYKK